MAASWIKVLPTVLVATTVVFHGMTDDETHHAVVGGGENGWGWGSVGSRLSGRVFRVGDKLWFNAEGSVELEQLLSCDLLNPIRMYTDLQERAGTSRYFTVANLESCMKGLRVPISVEPRPEPKPMPVFPPPSPIEPPPEPKPLPVYSPPPPPSPPEPVEPPPEPKPKPVYPPSPPPPPYKPSFAVNLKGTFSYVLFAGLVVCYIGSG